MHTELSDMAIISQVLQGQQSAFAGLVSRYQNYVFTIVLRYVKSREDAEEVAQDVFIKAYRSLADFKGTAKFSTWLYTIVTTTCITYLRKKKPEIQSLDNENVFSKAAAQSGGMEANVVEQKSKATMIHRAINMLNAEDAEMLTLFYKAEQTLDEIAQVLHITPNTAKVRLHRARTRLKEKLQLNFAAELKDVYSLHK